MKPFFFLFVFSSFSLKLLRFVRCGNRIGATQVFGQCPSIAILKGKNCLFFFFILSGAHDFF